MTDMPWRQNNEGRQLQTAVGEVSRHDADRHRDVWDDADWRAALTSCRRGLAAEHYERCCLQATALVTLDGYAGLCDVRSQMIYPQ